MRTETIPLREGRDDVTMTTDILDDSASMLGGASRPAVLILPGGGYLSCSDREAEPIAMAFASLGYHAFVLRYSVYGDADPTRPLEPRERSQFPHPLVDVGLAMREIRTRSGEWLVDVDRIAVCGFSAGGHNAAMYATHWDKPVITGAAGEGLRPAALIAVTPSPITSTSPKGPTKRANSNRLCAEQRRSRISARPSRRRKHSSTRALRARLMRTRLPPSSGAPRATPSSRRDTACASPRASPTWACRMSCTCTRRAATVCPSRRRRRQVHAATWMSGPPGWFQQAATWLERRFALDVPALRLGNAQATDRLSDALTRAQMLR